MYYLYKVPHLSWKPYVNIEGIWQFISIFMKGQFLKARGIFMFKHIFPSVSTNFHKQPCFGHCDIASPLYDTNAHATSCFILVLCFLGALQYSNW